MDSRMSDSPFRLFSQFGLLDQLLLVDGRHFAVVLVVVVVVSLLMLLPLLPPLVQMFLVMK